MERTASQRPRTACALAWAQFYRQVIDCDGRPAAYERATRAVDVLLERMREVNRSGGAIYKGYSVRELRRVLAIALSVHKQAVGGLSSASGGRKINGRRAGID